MARGERRRVLVTGAAGFIGSHVCERLLAEGVAVIGVDGFVGVSTRAEAQANLAPARRYPTFDFVEAEVLQGLPSRALRGATAVFHLAARPGVRESDIRAIFETNVKGTARVLADAHAAGVRDFVLASSSSVYGIGSRGPSREDDALRPASPYARSKLLAEHLCRRSPLRTVTVRYFTVYGPRQRSDMAFARFIEAARWGSPAPLHVCGYDPVRDFTYVSDAVEGTLRAWQEGRPGGVYNLAGGRPVALSEARRCLEQILGSPVPCVVRHAEAVEAVRTHADLRRARRELGYRPGTRLDNGLREQVAWAYRSAGKHAVREAVLRL